MSNISEKDIKWLLQDGKQFDYSSATNIEKKPSPSFKRYAIRIGVILLLVIIAIIIPFFVLIKTSLYLSTNQNLNSWIALVIGMMISAVICTSYLVLLLRKLKNHKRTFRIGLVISSLLIGSFCFYGTLYLSGVNAKSDSVRETYRSLHPVLRVAIATTTLADKSLVVTDIERVTEDYMRMGLPTNQSSLHFVQDDGFVHAIDLRTKSRSELRNFMLESSLKIMGFKTKRHIGTADHLHISIP